MKKLIVAFAMVAMAACAQAAVVNWGTGSTAVAFNGTKLGGVDASLYIVGVGGAADVLIDTRSTLANPPVNKGKITSSNGSGQSSYDYNSTIAGGALWNSDSGDLGRQYYMVITYNDGTKDYTYTSSAVASSACRRLRSARCRSRLTIRSRLLALMAGWRRFLSRPRVS